MDRRMLFIGNCSDVGSYESINEMRDQARKITWRTFRKHCVAAFGTFCRRGGITPETTHDQIEESQFFAFYKSVFEGKPCYYATWSGFEWIWQ